MRIEDAIRDSYLDIESSQAVRFATERNDCCLDGMTIL